MELTQAQEVRVLNSVFFRKRKLEDVAKALVSNVENNINDYDEILDHIKTLVIKNIHLFTQQKKYIKPIKEVVVVGLEWMNKSESEPSLLNEEDYNEIPLPKEWKLY